jgi:poly-beta-1,6-N-acetyl-D-glucosamine N-deacetylase
MPRYQTNMHSLSRPFKRTARDLTAGLLGLVINALGLVRRKREGTAPGQILPLCFHDPQPRLFREVIAWLKDNGFTFISAEDLLDILSGRRTLAGKAAWINFDDGWRGNIRNVLPWLMENSIPATFFLSTGPIEDPEGLFWWSLMDDNRRLLPTEFRHSVEGMFTIPEARRREIVEGVARGDHVRTPRQAMTVDEVKTIAALPLVTIGSHTVRHGVAVNHGETELFEELSQSKEKLQEWTGKEVRFFSFPRGVFDARARDMLARLGYRMAFTTEPVYIDSRGAGTADLFMLPRIILPDRGCFSEISCHLTGVWQPFMKAAKSFGGSLRGISRGHRQVSGAQGEDRLDRAKAGQGLPG